MKVDFKKLFSELDIKWKRRKKEPKKEETKHKEDLLKVLRSTPV